MEKFMGTKTIWASAMTRAEYNKYRNWELPEDENGDDRGYIVEYVDGGPSNHPSHKGYISWSPEEVFNLSYQDINNLSFSHAIQAVQKGEKVTRLGWNGKNMFIFLVPSSTFEVSRLPLLGIFEKGTKVYYNSHIDMKTDDGEICVWSPSQIDMASNDWRIIK